MGRKALYRINRDVSLSRAMGDLDLKVDWLLIS
jgi:hypothetical protein